MPGEYEIETMGGDTLDAQGAALFDGDDETFNIADYLSPEEQRLQENLGTAYRDSALRTAEEKTAEDQAFEWGGGGEGAPAAADPSGIAWWNRSMDATVGGLSRLTALGAQGLQLKRMLDRNDPAPVARPQQVFTRSPASGWLRPAEQASIFPARWSAAGQPGVLLSNYASARPGPASITSDMLASEPAKIIAWTLAALLAVWALSKMAFR